MKKTILCVIGVVCTSLTAFAQTSVTVNGQGTVTNVHPTNFPSGQLKVNGVVIVETLADASTTLKGVSKLSVAPISSTNPIVVGDNDTRNTNARPPTAHASTHASGGSDPVALAISQTTGLQSALDLKAPLASPAFTGIPTVPTAAVDTTTTQVASTAFVIAQAASATPVVAGTGAAGTSTRYARADHIHPSQPALAPANNLSDVANSATALQNLGAFGASHVAKSIAFTVVAGDRGKIFEITTGASNLVVTMPSAATAGNGFVVVLRKADSGAGLITNSATAGALGISGHEYELRSDGTNWYQRFLGGSTDASGNYTLSTAGTMTFNPGASSTLGSNWTWHGAPVPVLYGGTADTGTAWTTYTPTVTSTTGTITTLGTVTGRYKQIGKTVFVQMSIDVTTNGSGASSVKATLAVTASANAYVLSGRENITGGKTLSAVILASDGTSLRIFNYDNTYPASDGCRLLVTGVYEAN